MDKMLFMTGENQAEKHHKLIEHLTNEVLGKKEMGLCMLAKQMLACVVTVASRPT